MIVLGYGFTPLLSSRAHTKHETSLATRKWELSSHRACALQAAELPDHQARRRLVGQPSKRWRNQTKLRLLQASSAAPAGEACCVQHAHVHGGERRGVCGRTDESGCIGEGSEAFERTHEHGRRIRMAAFHHAAASCRQLLSGLTERGLGLVELSLRSTR